MKNNADVVLIILGFVCLVIGLFGLQSGQHCLAFLVLAVAGMLALCIGAGLQLREITSRQGGDIIKR